MGTTRIRPLSSVPGTWRVTLAHTQDIATRPQTNSGHGLRGRPLPSLPPSSTLPAVAPRPPPRSGRLVEPPGFRRLLLEEQTRALDRDRHHVYRPQNSIVNLSVENPTNPHRQYENALRIGVSGPCRRAQRRDGFPEAWLLVTTHGLQLEATGFGSAAGGREGNTSGHNKPAETSLIDPEPPGITNFVVR